MSLFGIPFDIDSKSDKRISSILDSEIWSKIEVSTFINDITKSYYRLLDVRPCSEYDFSRNSGVTSSDGSENIFIYLPRKEYFP